MLSLVGLRGDVTRDDFKGNPAHCGDISVFCNF